jgi:hypothetical protein
MLSMGGGEMDIDIKNLEDIDPANENISQQVIME